MQQQINLYQSVVRKQRQLFAARTLVQAVGVVAVALLGVYGYGAWRVAALETEVLQLTSREQAVTAQLAGIDPSLGDSRRAEVEEELRRLGATLRDQQRLIGVLREQPLGSPDGFSGHLAALGRQHTAELWLTSFAVDGGTGALELQGRSVRAELVPEYLQRLGSESALAGQRFDRLEIEREEGNGEIVFRATSAAAGADPWRDAVAREP
jgi:MSHA biogenesis protein MshI